MDWRTAATFLTLTFFGVGSLVYFLLKKDSEDQDLFLFNKTKTCVLEVKVPIESIGIVIGRGGNTIKEVEHKSNVKIHVKDENNTSSEYKICVIRGSPEGTQYAESLIHELIVSQPLIITHSMYVPAQACGRIIGKNGDNIRLISRNSNAKIIVENATTSPVSLERKITLKGTAEQIGIAEYLIQQKVDEDAEFRKKLETQLSSRPPRNKMKYILPAKGETEDIESHPQKQKFISTGTNGLLEVYVSAIESPNRFWLQMLGPCTVELDKLIEQMTDYYVNEKNKECHKLGEVKCGQIVAAPFTYDSKWYRAEVQEIISNDKSEEPDLQLYYVDYGDSSRFKKSHVYELRTDFLRLRFQAIECTLAKVKPRDSCWSDEATNVLEDLMHVALWKSLLAKIHSYVDRPTTGGKREASPVPCVELYDADGDRTIDVAEELVAKGYALWTEDHSGQPDGGHSPG